MAHDSARCEDGWEITTYDSLDQSLGQARASTYLAVKCWASWVGLEMLATLRGGMIDPDFGLAGELADYLAHAAGADGVLPAVLEADNPGYDSRILPAIEGLVYLAYWRACLCDRPDAQADLQQWLEHPLIATLGKHTIALLSDPQKRNLFADGGIKLSSTSDNSWASKIALFQHVARNALHLHETDPKIAAQFARADSAHVAWQTDGSGYWACSDQFVNGVAKGSRYYPRIITAAEWLKETTAEPAAPKVEVTIHLEDKSEPLMNVDER